MTIIVVRWMLCQPLQWCAALLVCTPWLGLTRQKASQATYAWHDYGGGSDQYVLLFVLSAQ
jgi:hypothetical protein